MKWKHRGKELIALSLILLTHSNHTQSKPQAWSGGVDFHTNPSSFLSVISEYKVQFSLLTNRVVGGHDRQLSRGPLPVFFAGGPCEWLWHKQRCPLFDVVHPAFPLLTTALPILQGALTDSSAEVVTVCDTREPWQFLPLESWQKKFLLPYKEVDLAPHPVVGLVLQAGDAEKFPQALGFESLDPFLGVSKRGLCFTAIEEGGGDERLVLLEPSCKADGAAFSLATAAISEEILKRISAEQVPSLHRVAPRYLKAKKKMKELNGLFVTL